MSKYQIWDKASAIYTPSGAVFTPAQWIDRYGWINNPAAVPVVAGGLINGAFSGELSQMVDMYTNMGCDFSNCATNQDKLDAIEAFENRPVEASNEPTVEERTAAALEFLAVNSLPDATETN